MYYAVEYCSERLHGQPSQHIIHTIYYNSLSFAVITALSHIYELTK